MSRRDDERGTSAARGRGDASPPRRRFLRGGFLRPAAGMLLATMAAHPAVADGASGLPKLSTNQQYIEEARADSTLDVASIPAVFKYLLDSLPDTVKVYPTENYFYFSFVHDGIRWAGNLRFDVETRDAGKVHITYFKEFTAWQQDEHDHTAVLGAADGVTVERLRNLVYRVTYAGRSVVFELNDLSKVVPPDAAVRPQETYLGPVFDESGVRFFLVFDPQEKLFLFVLDETVPPGDELYPSAVSENLTIGRRTGFAFYRDRFTGRRILVGVNAGNTGVNNYLDGPFDQLPDNFLKGNELLDAILAVSPELAGTLDRFGNSADDTVRYLIAPYLQYEFEDELGAFDACTRAVKPAAYYGCFAPGAASDAPPPPPPDAGGP